MATKAELLKALPENIKNHIANFKALTTLGRNLAGTLTVTGLKVGDVVIAVAGLTAGSLGDQSALFAQTITAANTLSQISATDQSAKTFIVFVI